MAQQRVREREHLCELGLSELWRLYPICNSRYIYYMKPNKSEAIGDHQNTFLASVTNIIDYQPGSKMNESGATWFGETTFCYGKAMYFRAQYQVEYEIDTMQQWISVNISSDPARIGGASHF